MNKEEIIENLENERENFMDAIEDLPEEALLTPGVVGEWSLKDVMAHISAWEAELIKLLWQAKQGQRPSSIHFSKISVDDTNQAWYEANRERPLERVMSDFLSVRKQTKRRTVTFSNEELNDPHSFPWLGERPLWEWIANDSYEHEAEHREQILAWREKEGI